MPNDAKLGLLAGVLGVIVAGVLTANRPTGNAGVPSPDPQQAAAKAAEKPSQPLAAESKPASEPDPKGEPDTPAVLPGELPSTPVVRTEKEPDATPAGRRDNP